VVICFNHISAKLKSFSNQNHVPSIANGVSLNVGYKTTKEKERGLQVYHCICSFLGDAYMIMLTAANLMAARQETLKFNTS